MKKVFLFPTETEAERFRKAAPEAEVRISGVGMAETAVATANALREGYRCLILAGIAGTYDPTLEAGTTVVVREERQAGLPERYARSYTNDKLPKGLPSVVSNTVSSCGAEAHGAQIENMEGAVFFALCADAGVRFCEVRSVSNMVGAAKDEWQTDTALDNLTQVLVKSFVKDGFMDKAKVVLYCVAALIVFGLVALVVVKWEEWFRTAAIWVLIILAAFFMGWLCSRFARRRKKTPKDK